MTRLAGSLVSVGLALALIGCAGQQTAPETSPAGATAGQGHDTSGDVKEAPGDPGAEPGGEQEAPDDPGAGDGDAEGTPGAPRADGKEHEFTENRSGTKGLNRGVLISRIKPTRTEAALKFTVVDRDKGPISGIVIKLESAGGQTYFTDETDAEGYAEVLVPVGQEYEVVYLSLGRRQIAARLPVSREPRQTIRLKLRYKRHDNVKLVLEGVQFDSGRATLRPGSHSKLDRVVEFMKYKKSARIAIAGHTDNVGSPRRNKALSLRRAQACRRYLVSRGIAARRVKAVGYGQERPIASNDTAEGRQQNRRIEASELTR